MSRRQVDSNSDRDTPNSALIGAIILGILSALLALSELASLLGHLGFWAMPGAFFVSAYGYFAFFVPLYLLLASLILLDSSYRPDRIFALTCTILPFLTIALGISILRFPFPLYESFPILESLGSTFIGTLVAILVVLEAFAISSLTRLLFPARRRKLSREVRSARSHGNELRLRFLPAPAVKTSPPDTIKKERAVLTLPELRPLSSLQTEQELKAPPSVPQELEGSFLSSKGPLPEETEIIDISPLLGSPLPVHPDGMVNIDPSEFLEEEKEEVLVEAGSIDAIDEVDAVDDLEKAISEAEKEAELKSREAEAAAALRAAEGYHHPIPARRRPNAPYGIPVDDILNVYPDGQYWIIDQATRDAAVILKETLEEFNIAAEVTGIKKGPVITMFEILPAPGVKLSKIVNLQDNIALRLAASSVRIVAPIPGKHAVGIEVPNHKRAIVSFREMIEGELHKDGKKAEIPVILGKSITGEAQTLDLVQTPHLLIAGATGSGKSVCVNSMILSILYQKSPAEVRLILIDPKIVELKLYNDIPHLLTPVITEPKRAFQALQYCIFEMERRYALLDSMGVRDIRSYNKRIKERSIATEHLPYIVVVIDEFADLMATTGKELESTVARLAAMSRAVGVHLVLATQRPSIDVITGLIKANIPSRIAFMVASKMDSRIIIDMVGAEKLLGRGDMLFASAWDPFPTRMQGAFVSEEEVERVVEYVKTLGAPDYIDEEIFYDEEDAAEPGLFTDEEDPLYDHALTIVSQQGKASASYIQRRLKIGYNRAARIVELMEERGIVGPAQGSKPRELLRAP